MKRPLRVTMTGSFHGVHIRVTATGPLNQEEALGVAAGKAMAVLLPFYGGPVKEKADDE